jgi:hypothetical protein
MKQMKNKKGKNQNNGSLKQTLGKCLRAGALGLALGASIITVGTQGCKEKVKSAKVKKLTAEEEKRIYEENCEDPYKVKERQEKQLLAQVKSPKPDIKKVRDLLERGTSPRTKDKDGKTVIEIAKEEGKNKTRDILKEYRKRYPHL